MELLERIGFNGCSREDINCLSLQYNVTKTQT